MSVPVVRKYFLSFVFVKDGFQNFANMTVERVTPITGVEELKGYEELVAAQIQATFVTVLYWRAYEKP